MQTNGSPTLLQRIGRLLRAKQFLVFYAIGLFALLYVPPLATGWLRDHRPLDVLVRDSDALLADLWARHSLLMALIIALAIVLQTWFRAGYLRSLLGRLHWGPVDGRQFRRLLGLMVTLELIAWGTSAAAVALGLSSDDVTLDTRTQLLVLGLILVQLLVAVALLYADYAIVVSSVTLLQSLRRSLDTVRANRLVSLLAVGLSLIIFDMTTSALSGIQGAGAAILPSIVILIVVRGALSFVLDVVLIAVYIDTIERRGTQRDD
jgi:hypothetical protein